MVGEQEQTEGDQLAGYPDGSRLDQGATVEMVHMFWRQSQENVWTEYRLYLKNDKNQEWYPGFQPEQPK